jgi:5-methylcytosine-specific restriction endonuclease McrA
MTQGKRRGSRSARRAVLPAALRDAVHLRDGFACVYCGSTGGPGRGVVITIDHVVPLYFGGEDSPLNLVTACDLCNWMKGIYPLDLWVQLAERLGHGTADVIRERVRAALGRKLTERK